MRRRYVSVVGFILVAVLLLAGCTTQPQNAGNTESKSIVIKGSDTEVNMVQALAEEFRNQHPDITISVSGGGSGSGIAALINGEIDIANSSREISQEELDQAKANNIEIGTFIDARDGITVIVHPNNPVEKLTLDQIGKIYRGEITNWKEVGGKDMPKLTGSTGCTNWSTISSSGIPYCRAMETSLATASISAGATDPLAFVNTSMGRPFSSTFTVTYNVPVPVLNFFVKPVSTSGRFGNILFGLGS